MRMVPAVGVNTPSSIDRVVVFPAPLPPSSAVVVPRLTSKSIPFTASSWRYDLRSARTSMTAAGTGTVADGMRDFDEGSLCISRMLVAIVVELRRIGRRNLRGADDGQGLRH